MCLCTHSRLPTLHASAKAGCFVSYEAVLSFVDKIPSSLWLGLEQPLVKCRVLDHEVSDPGLGISLG